ncbi:nucleoside hydrolase [Priestia taiwanensis]|uniref:Nucleoside hydrolase n=1 Tax=Priestia taiwanensis TaxID=1347902 RepID=A0A917EQI6_9BACI|nr:nucleoside hydrolase [Priestia taiwanensis]MBM7364293.1 purine nucleosidase [Priestia taiwanensis]GGE73259.1 nucleoside hydrolase [Priestia taiwanensis]
MRKVLLFGDPGIDDSLAIMYALLHPDIELVGIVAGYGNVSRDQATKNAAYLLQLAKREDIPIIAGAIRPLSGEVNVYYPEIHGPSGLGPIRPPANLQVRIYPFQTIFSLVNQYKNELTIIDVGRSTSLAITFLLGEETMKKVKEYYIMGGAFLTPGNVTPLAEANVFGDPTATQIVLEQAQSVTMIPLNVTNKAIITPAMIDYILKQNHATFEFLIQPIFHYYFKSYQKLQPGSKGAPLHDLVTFSALSNPSLVEYTYREVEVVSTGRTGNTRGLTVADFRPRSQEKSHKKDTRIGLNLHTDAFVQDFINIMSR